MYYQNQKPKVNWFISLLHYLRDIFVSYLPIRKLPKFVINLLYGSKINFVFFVHARRSQDFFASIPALTFLRKILGKKRFLNLMSVFPGKVVSVIKTQRNISGLVLVSTLMPNSIGANRNKALMEMKRMLNFSRRVSAEKFIVGLGGWWPIVTSRGRYLKDLIDDSMTVTIGHTVTILSIYLMIEKIRKMGDIQKEKCKILIVGAGKIGSQLADILVKKGYQSISFMDVNQARLEKLSLHYRPKLKNIKIYNGKEFQGSKKSLLDNYHLAVCATSTMNKVIKEEDIPSNFIIIDDSRPEAVGRNLKSDDKIVLEGGLMKIEGLLNDYDYGLGKDDNFFGCYCEAYLLALGHLGRIKPTTGDVSYKNFLNYKSFCDENGVSVGDFKNAERTIPASKIKTIITERKKYLSGR